MSGRILTNKSRGDLEEKMYFKQLKVLIPATCLFAFGCSSNPDSSSNTISRSSLLVAVDTSGSAKAYKKNYFKDLNNFLIDLPPQERVVIFRFDAAPAEVHDGPPPETLEKSSQLLIKTLDYSTETRGTNMKQLVSAFDTRLSRGTNNYDIRIYTDCGVEDMTAEQKRESKELVEKWVKSGRLNSITLFGVQHGRREDLRAIFDVDGVNLEFQGDF